MHLLRRLSVHGKLIAILMISNAAALALAGIGLVAYGFLDARETMSQELAIFSRVIGGRSTAALSFEDPATATRNLEALSGWPSIIFACLYNEENRLFAKYAQRTGSAGAAAETPCPAKPPRDGGRFEAGAVLAVDPVMLDRERIGTLYLHAGLEMIHRRVRQHAGVIILVFLFASSVALIFVARLRRLVSDPIEHLVTTAGNISREKDYTLRVSAVEDPELDVLVDALNRMLATVEEQNRDLLESQKNLEDLVAELETKNAELESFTYTVSHDLKSPLFTIEGFLGLLRKDATQGDLSSVEKDIQHVRDATQQMSRLLGDLLELSRIGRLVNEPERVSVNELAQDAVRRVAGKLEERGVRADIAPDMPAIVGDRDRLVEVFQNLVENAVKFMGDEPRPRIELGHTSASTDRNEDVFFVRDNGCGIDRRYRDKIFGLFERLDAKVEGTGIGLAIVKRIVEHHGGRIWVESQGLGHGSTFYFTLPGTSASPGEGPAAATTRREKKAV